MEHSWLSLTWWIPLPESIDLPDRHTRYVTAVVHPTHAAPDGKPLDETDPFTQVDHELRLTVHQREIDVSIASPVQKAVFEVAHEVQQEGDTQAEGVSGTRISYLSVIEAEARVYGIDDVDEGLTTDLFDMALDRIRQLQEGLALITQDLKKDWVAKERLPAMLPLRTQFSDSEDNSDDLSVFLVNQFALTDVSPPEPIPESKFADLTEYLSMDDHEASFSTYHRLRYETSVLCHRRGDFRMTVISAAIAAESLLDEMLMLLLWDEGNQPETVAYKFSQSGPKLLSRVKSEYSRHLGGEWSPGKKGAVREWREKIAEPRNQIAHAGAIPTRQHAIDAVRALNSLEQFLGRRLRTRIAQRPRAATLFIGGRTLEAEGEITNRLRTLYNDPWEPHWASTFRRWRDVLELEVAKTEGSPVQPVRDRAVVAVVVGEQSLEFTLLDETALMAARISPVPDNLVSQYERSLAEREPITPEPRRNDVCRLMQEDLESKRRLQLVGGWRYAYKLIPTYSVMANRRDRDVQS
ncbi:hypothetical protein [Nesterenkonia sphaerica]|uniref:Apea-like HEPN domain-containing protein n=1 Tax=Nesterenkonia sphaerica TaxID=1804988 RepID=A0A5R9A670_9MICC|nr:hypothetical protein [Nesterenkonia sphaerica]TLP73306.1 hypothetical protein FEF27_10405 [Nesterenkonia sphaerica]